MCIGRAPLGGTLALFLAAAAPAWAIDRTWTGASSANWATAGNWTPSGVPGAADRAIIPAVVRPPVISAAPATINQLQVQAGGLLTINGGFILTVDGGAAPIIDGTGTVAGAGTLLVSSGASGSILFNQSITVGNFTLNANNGRNYQIPSGVVVTATGLFRVQQAELRVLAGGTLDLDGNLQIDTDGDLNLFAATSLLRLAGNWTQTGDFLAGIGSTVILDGAGPQTLNVQRNSLANVDFENLRVSNTGGLVAYLANNSLGGFGFQVLGNFTLDAGASVRIDEPALVGNAAADVFGIGSGASVTFTQQLDPDCAISFDIDGGADDGLLVLQGTALPPSDSSDFGFSLVPGRGTVRLQITSNATFEVDSAAYSFYNLEIDTDGGNGQVGTDVITLSAGITVLGDLILTEGQLAVGAFTLDVRGNIDSSAPSASQLDATSGSTVFRVAGNVDLDSFSQASAGTAGPFSLLHFDGTAPQTFQLRSTANPTYHDVDAIRVSNPAGVTILDNPNADFITNGAITIDAGATLVVQDTYDADGPLVFAAGGGNLLRLEGAIVDDASELGTSFTAGTGTVVYAGQGVSQTVFTRINGSTPIAYHHLTIDNTGAAVATQEAAGLLDVNGSFTIQAAGAAFSSAAGGMAVARDFTSNGTFNHAGATVTMDGTGTIGGASPALLFNNLLVNTAGVVTAGRSFSTQAAFQVQQGVLTTAGAPPGIVMTALSGMSVGDGAGGAGSAELELLGAATLAVQPGQTFSVAAADGRLEANAAGAGVPTLTRAGGAGAFDAVVNGQVEIRRLNFSFGDLEGLEIAPSASITALRGVSFTGIFPAANSRHLTIRSAGLDLDCPGCIFAAVPPGSFNVWVDDTAPGLPFVRVRFEDRGAAPAAGGGGPGAGEAFDADDDTNDNGLIDGAETTTLHGGAIAQWVYTANIDLSGTMQGFPMPAWDWNTLVHYSTYVPMRNAAGTTSILFVLNAEGDPKGYSYSFPGMEIVGPVYFDTEGADHVVYVAANEPTIPEGRLYKLIDTGAALVPAPPPWDTPFTRNPLRAITSPVLSDLTNVYFGGEHGAANALYKVEIASKTLPSGVISTAQRRIATAPSWADTATGRFVYMASGVQGGRSNIYRIDAASWTLDATFTDTSLNPPSNDCTSDFVAITNVPISYLYVGETNGYMHSLTATGTPAQFLVPEPGYPFRDASSAAVRGGAVWEITRGRLFYGDDAGAVYTLVNSAYSGGWILGTNYFRFVTPFAGPIPAMPLYLDGVIYAADATGHLHAIDADTGAGQALIRTFTLGLVALGDVSRDFNTGRIYVGTAGGRLYAVPDIVDPTGPK